MPAKLQWAVVLTAALAVLTCSAAGPKPARELSRLSAPVQKTIHTRVGDGTLDSIEKTVEDGETTYHVEMTRAGKSRGFTVSAEGDLLDEEVFLNELPSAVQQTIQKEAEGGTLGEIDKSTEDGEASYEAEMTRDGKTRTFTVDAKGKLVETQVFLSELPLALQKAIQSASAGSKLGEIYKCFDDDDVSYDVETTINGKSRTLSFDPDGSLISTEEEIELSAAPEAVQKEIKILAGSGQFIGISKLTEDDDVSYQIDLKTAGKEKSASLDPTGKVLPGDQ